MNEWLLHLVYFFIGMLECLFFPYDLLDRKEALAVVEGFTSGEYEVPLNSPLAVLSDKASLTVTISGAPYFEDLGNVYDDDYDFQQYVRSRDKLKAEAADAIGIILYGNNLEAPMYLKYSLWGGDGVDDNVSLHFHLDDMYADGSYYKVKIINRNEELTVVSATWYPVGVIGLYVDRAW